MAPSIVRSLAAPLACAAALACSSGEGTDPNLLGGVNPDATIFLAQKTPPDAVMEALFQGRIVRDARGCLRTDGPEPATLVWPYGFRLEGRADGLHVKDASGRSIGRIGGGFRFGGGYVPTLDAAELTDADRALAESRCPGNYFVVGDTDLDR